MSNSDFVISSRQRIREGDVAANRPNSEAINQRIAGAINSLIDTSFLNYNIRHDGHIQPTPFFESAPIRITGRSTVVYYDMSLGFSGNSGETSFNFKVYDDTGAFINNLFGSGIDRVMIDGSNLERVVIGRDLDNSIAFNNGLTVGNFQHGNLNLNILESGWIIVPFVEGNSIGARSLGFNLRIREE